MAGFEQQKRHFVSLLEFLLDRGLNDKDIVCHPFCSQIVLEPRVKSTALHDRNVTSGLVTKEWTSLKKTTFFSELICSIPQEVFEELRLNYDVFVKCKSSILLKLSASSKEYDFSFKKSNFNLSLATLIGYQQSYYSNKACTGACIDKLLRLGDDKQLQYLQSNIMQLSQEDHTLSSSEANVLVNILSAISRSVKRINLSVLLPRQPVIEATAPIDELIKVCRTPCKEICNFLSSLIIILIPIKDVFGSCKSRRVFIKDFMKLIRSSSDFDRSFLTKIPSERLPLINSKLAVFTDHPQVIANFFYIVITEVIVPILKHQFYMCREKFNLLYFRKPLWERVQAEGFTQLTSYLTPMDEDAVQFLHLSNKLFGIYSIRIQPKQNNEFRTISLLNKNVQCSIQTKLPVNPKLIPTTAILKAIHGSMFSQQSIYPIKGRIDLGKKITVFKNELLAKNDGTLPELFYFLCDAKCCYDNLELEILCKDVMYWLNWEPFYHILKYKSFCHLTHITKTKNLAVPSKQKEMLAFEEMCESLESVSKHCTITLIKYKVYSKAFAQQNVRNFLCNSVITHQDVFYKRTKGIPQGAKVSKLLCDFYFCFIFKEVLLSCDSLFLSATDDFLLLSVNKLIVDNFMNDCIGGKYPFILNKNKTKMYNPETSVLKYYGLKIDSATLCYS